MKNHSSRPPMSLRSALALAALVICSLGAMTVARADDPLGTLGLYIGAAYGQAHVRAQLDGLSGASGAIGSLGDFDSTNTAYQAMIGIRPVSFLGGEITYMDLGQRSIYGPGEPLPGGVGYVSGERVSQQGEAAFGMLYLPVPIVDVYIKAGLSRITTHMSATLQIPDNVVCDGCNAASAVHTDVGFAYGTGLQWKLGQWAVRGEYERFSAAGENPSLLSIGMTYWLQ
jgi:opacity protein-like surface antigen